MSISTAASPAVRQGMVKRLGTGLLHFCLPASGKRSLLLTSLFVEIAKISPTHEQCLLELNEKLKLASHVDALKFPAAMHGRFWRNAEFDQMSDGQVDNTCNRILTQMPRWMQYATPERMSEDIREVLQLGRRVHATPA